MMEAKRVQQAEREKQDAAFRRKNTGNRSGFRVMAELIGLVKPLSGYMCLAILAGLVGHLCAAFITILGGYAVLAVLGVQDKITEVQVFLTVPLLALLRAGLRYGEQSCNHFIAFKLLALIRDKVFRALRRLCPAKLEGRGKGDLIAVITSDIELLEVFYAHTISPAAIAFLFTLILCGFIGSFHPTLGLLALAAYVTVGVLVPLAISKTSGDHGIRFRSGAGELSGYVLDSLRGLTETIQYGRGQARLDGMMAKTDALSSEEEKMKAVSGRNTAITNTVILLFDLAMLGVSVVLYRNGAVSYEGVLIPTIALMSSFGPCVALAALGSTLQNTFAAGNRVLDILEEAPAVEEITGKPEIVFQGADVEHVTFSYENPQETIYSCRSADEKIACEQASSGKNAISSAVEKHILTDVSVEIPEHSVIGITGRSGSGKSTLLKLLMRFWTVQQGEVKLSGTSVEEINTANLREMEGFVTQETHLFHDSIRNNLRIAKLDATEEEMIAACKKASVHDFIMTLPQGYDTPVGELGDTLSGGERQRIGLARAFLHDAPFLLLDEPTSNLDSLNEAVILKSLREEKEDKTVVLVSHRESTMRIADRTYSVENGRMS